MIKEILRRSVSPLLEKIQLFINQDSFPFEWYYKHSKRLLKFKDLHKGENCFIIGNGPSLNNMDLTPLKDYHTIGLNKIYLMFEKVNLNLSYHVAVNSLVIKQSIKEFESLSCPSFLSHRPAYGLIQNLNNIYLILTGGPFTFRDNITQEINEGGTVTFVALQIAYYMGFDKIFLIGVDHNFKVAGVPNEKQFLGGEDVNHFDPRYFGNKEWQLPDLEASELAYHIAKYNYSLSGRRIYDSTFGGKLEIFPKISYEQALKICKKKI